MISKKNILVLTEIYPDPKQIWRGAFCKEQATILSNVFNVTVVSFEIVKQFSYLPKLTLTKKEAGSLTEYRLEFNSTLFIYNLLYYYFTTYSLIIRDICKNKKFDLIHCHFSYPAGFMGFLINRKIKVPYIITEHSSSFQGLFRTPLHKWAVKMALTNSSSIIAVGNELKNDIIKFFQLQIEIIPNVVDDSRFKLKTTRKEETLKIGFIGQLEDNRKGLDILLNALKGLPTLNYKLIVAGGGKLFDYYTEMSESLGIRNHCEFIDKIPPENVPDFLENIDLFILPSRKESFGVVLIEAMATGLPVISTICGGPEFFVTPDCGLIIEKDNIKKLEEAIKNISLNLSHYNPKIIREYAVKNFGRQSFLNKISSIINKVS